MKRLSRAPVLAWALGAAGTVACVAAGAEVVALGAPLSFLLIYVVGVLLAVLGALVAARQPGNSIGWLMLVSALTVSLTHLSAGYGYTAVVTEHGAWPLGSFAIWLGAWSYGVVLGYLFPAIAFRFPNGRVPSRWRAADLVAIAGTALFVLGIALQPWDVFVTFLAIPGTKVAQLTSHVAVGHGVLSVVQGIGLTLIALAYVAAAASLITRFRGAGGDERQQLKWFAYAGSLISVTFLYGAVAWNFFGQPLYLALTPLEFAASTLPVAIGVAILRYRLYDIDLIINRTLVYGTLTAILGAVYAAVVTLLNRLFIAASGQKSDAAYVVTAFVVVVASSPVKDWLQRSVDRRIAHRSPAAVLDALRSDVDAVVSVIDVHKVARRLLDDAVSAFDARGAALYLNPDDAPAYTRGRLNGETTVEVALRYEDRRLGRLVLGSRRGDVTYTERDLVALQRSADSIAEALALAAHLGFKPMPRSRTDEKDREATLES